MPRYKATKVPDSWAARAYSDEIRIGACADYLLDIPIATITHRWGVAPNTVTVWIKRTGSFQLRRRTKGNHRSTFSIQRVIKRKIPKVAAAVLELKPNRFYRPFQDDMIES